MEWLMPQRLQKNCSPAMCIRYSNRHSRLCTQVAGGENLRNEIKVQVTATEEKMKAKEVAEDARDGFYDLIIFSDADLDNRVRTAASKCKEYDRSNPTARIYETIFPENTGPIIDTNPENEPAEVMKVVSRIQTLGKDHQLTSLAAYLTEGVEKSNEYIKQYLASIAKVGMVDAELQIAKANLIKQYIANMFEAEKMFGRKYAARLFPKLNTNSSDAEENVEPALAK
jgi:hypothetical protein